MALNRVTEESARQLLVERRAACSDSGETAFLISVIPGPEKGRMKVSALRSKSPRAQPSDPSCQVCLDEERVRLQAEVIRTPTSRGAFGWVSKFCPLLRCLYGARSSTARKRSLCPALITHSSL